MALPTGPTPQPERTAPVEGSGPAVPPPVAPTGTEATTHPPIATLPPIPASPMRAPRIHALKSIGTTSRNLAAMPPAQPVPGPTSGATSAPVRAPVVPPVAGGPPTVRSVAPQGPPPFGVRPVPLSAAAMSPRPSAPPLLTRAQIIAQKVALQGLVTARPNWEREFDEIQQAVDGSDKYFPTALTIFSQSTQGTGLFTEINELLKRAVMNRMLGRRLSANVQVIPPDNVVVRLKNERPRDPSDPKFLAGPGLYWKMLGRGLHGTTVPLAKRRVTFTNEDVQPSDLQGKFPVKINIEYRLGTKDHNRKYTIGLHDIDRRARAPEDFPQDVKNAIKALMTKILSQFSTAELEQTSNTTEAGVLYEAACKLLTLKVNELILTRYGCTAYSVTLDPIRPKWYADHRLRVDAEHARAQEVALKAKNDFAEAQGQGEAAEVKAKHLAIAQRHRLRELSDGLQNAGADAAPLVRQLLADELQADALTKMQGLTTYVQGSPGAVPPIALPAAPVPTRKGPTNRP